MRFLIIIFISLFAGVVGFTQEILTGLQVNPMVKARAMEPGRMKYLTAGSDTLPINLPFFDDFSANDVFPSSKRWSDHFAFENDDLAVYPVNRGAMTLDA